MLSFGLLTLLLGTGRFIILPTQATRELTWSTNQFPLSTNLLAKSTKIIYVNPTLGSDNPGTDKKETASYRTITFAVQQAQAGTTIQLAPGTYSPSSGEQFPLVVKPGVILQGNESTKGQNVLIRGGGAYLSRTFASQNIAVVAQQGSEIKGITVTNPNSRGTGVWIESGNPIIQNNTFVNSLREGIFVTGHAVPKIIGNVFTQNQGNGLSVAKAAQGEIRGNMFSNTGFGIVISETATPLAIENTIINNKVGVVISHSAHPVLRQNRIENNQQYGVIAIAEAQPDLGTASSPGNNILRHNGQYDLYNLTNCEILMVSGSEIGISMRGKVEFPPEQSVEESPQVNMTTTARSCKSK
ncbi:MAG: DUF1565 domain-containing protein [Scytonema sp. CRU_2_7]|nr:DUF1565 domain-containing protein [Scytonema sp. CRU_2_7]